MDNEGEKKQIVTEKSRGEKPWTKAMDKSHRESQGKVSGKLSQGNVSEWRKGAETTEKRVDRRRGEVGETTEREKASEGRESSGEMSRRRGQQNWVWPVKKHLLIRRVWERCSLAESVLDVFFIVPIETISFIC